MLATAVYTLTGNQVNSRKGEVAKVSQEAATLEQQAAALKPYTQFATLSKSRLETVTSLADSRFNWERAMRDLARALPERCLADLADWHGGARRDLGRRRWRLDRVAAQRRQVPRDRDGRLHGEPVLGVARDGAPADHARRAAGLAGVLGEGRGGAGGRRSERHRLSQRQQPLPQFQLVVFFDAPKSAQAAPGQAGAAPQGTAAPATQPTADRERTVTQRDRIVVMVVIAVVALGGFWMLALKPKRKEASDLGQKLEQAHQRVDAAHAEVTAGEAARTLYARNYSTVARLGKAVPVDDDVPSLVYQLDSTAKETGVDFRTVKLSSGSGAAAVPPTSAAQGAAATQDNAQSKAASQDGKDAGVNAAASNGSQPPAAGAPAAGAPADAATDPVGHRGAAARCHRRRSGPEHDALHLHVPGQLLQAVELPDEARALHLGPAPQR